MKLIEVDPIGLEPAQTVLDCRHDVAARGALHDAGLAELHAEFCRQHDIFAPAAQNLAQAVFRAAVVAINVRGVEEGDAEIQCLMHHLAGRIEIDAPAEVIAAEADGRNLKARFSQRAPIHRTSLSLKMRAAASSMTRPRESSFRCPRSSSPG